MSMCRIFGFRSVINSQVHSSLVSTENALIEQSNKHPDGWGVSYYLHDSPHLIKSSESAIDDHIFRKVSGVVSSQTVLAHIRKATHGNNNLLNSHPFQYSHWTFAHNGNIKNFEKVKKTIESEIDPKLGRYILGTTDSETIFYFILTQFNKDGLLENKNSDVKKVASSLETSIHRLLKIIGPLSTNTSLPSQENFLTIILTNGPVMLAFQGGQQLHYCTYKKSCPEKKICSSYAPQCEAPPAEDNKINHLIFSSEQLAGQNIWLKLRPGQMMGVDNNMILFSKQLDIKFD